MSRPRTLRTAALLAAVGLLAPTAALSPAVASPAPATSPGAVPASFGQPYSDLVAAEAAAQYLIDLLDDGERVGDNAGFTADVAFALISIHGPQAATVTPVVDWLETAAAEYATDNPVGAAKLLLVAAAAGRDGSDFGGVDLPQVIADGMSEDGQYGSFGYAFGQALVITALVRAGEPVPDVAVENMLTYQGENGAFGYYQGEEFVTDTDASGLALVSLAALQDPEARGPLLDVRDWLLEVQTDEGYWEGFSPVNSTGYVSSALDVVGVDDRAATEWMVGQQLPDGGLPNVLDGQTSNLLATAQGALVLGGDSFLSVGVDGIDRVRVEDGTTTLRYDGGDRYETAVRVSWQFDPGVDAVYVARGDSFPDAIAAAAVAGAQGVPLLFTRTDRLPATTVAELGRLAPGEVRVLGGDSAVQDGVVAAAAQAAGADAVRVEGGDRYETAAALAGTPGLDADTVYVATGVDYPDALAAAAVAGAESAPVLLVKTDHVPSATAARLADLAPEEIVLLGGQTAVTPRVEGLLAAVAPVERVEGEDRYDTARLLAGEDAVAEVTVTSGQDWPDALAGSSGAAFAGTPLLLVKSDALPSATADAILALDPGYALVVGGQTAIQQGVLDAIEALGGE